MFQYRRILQPQLVRAQQQLGEVDQAGAAAGVFVGLVDVDERVRDRMVAMLDAVRPLALVLPVVDLPAGLTWRKFRIVQSQSGDHALDQPQLVVGIEDLEGFRQARLAPVPAQQAMGDAVERAHGEALSAAGNQCAKARAHLARRLVGEGDGEDRPWRHALGLGQPADPVGEYAGLAGTADRQQATDHDAGDADPLGDTLVVGGSDLGRADLQQRISVLIAGVAGEDPDAGHQQDDADDDQSCAHGCFPLVDVARVCRVRVCTKSTGKKRPRRLGGTFGAGRTRRPRGEVRDRGCSGR